MSQSSSNPIINAIEEVQVEEVLLKATVQKNAFKRLRSEVQIIILKQSRALIDCCQNRLNKSVYTVFFKITCFYSFFFLFFLFFP
jgi:hypothetical protein